MKTLFFCLLNILKCVKHLNIDVYSIKIQMQKICYINFQRFHIYITWFILRNMGKIERKNPIFHSSLNLKFNMAVLWLQSIRVFWRICISVSFFLKKLVEISKYVWCIDIKVDFKQTWICFAYTKFLISNKIWHISYL